MVRIFLNVLLLVFFAKASSFSHLNMLDPEKKTIAIIEPSGFGIGYVDAVKAKNYNLLVISSYLVNAHLYGYEGKPDATLTCNVHDIDAITAAIDTSCYKDHIDAIIAGNEYGHFIAAKLASHYGLKGLTEQSALAARRKDIARSFYEKAGLPNAKFQILHSLKDVERVVHNIGYPFILKPVDGCASTHVFKINTHDELIAATFELSKAKKGMLNFQPSEIYLAEEYLEGPEFSVEIFLDQGKIFFASVTEKVTLSPHFVEVMHVVPTTIYKEYVPSMIDMAYKAISSLGFTFGPCHVEMKLTQRGPIIIETNGRPGGGGIATKLLVEAFGINMFELFLDQLLGHPLTPPTRKHKGACVAFLTAPKKGFIKAVHGIESLDVFEYHLSASTGQLVHLPSSNADRYVQLITVKETPELAKKAAIQELQKLSFEYDDEEL